MPSRQPPLLQWMYLLVAFLYETFYDIIRFFYLAIDSKKKVIIIDAINKTTGKLNKVEGRPTPNGRTLPFRVNKEGGFVISRHTAKNKYKNMAFLTGQSKRNDILFLTNIFFMVNV